MKKKKSKHAVHFSSKKTDYPTPQSLFDELDSVYGPFTFDAAASHKNAKTKIYATKDGIFKSFKSGPFQLYGVDGLTAHWTGKVFLNPPYSRKLGLWVKKAYEESRTGATVVCLLPARHQRWFFQYIWCRESLSPYRDVIYDPLPGRIKFEGAKDVAPFPSMIVVFNPPGGNK